MQLLFKFIIKSKLNEFIIKINTKKTTQDSMNNLLFKSINQ